MNKNIVPYGIVLGLLILVSGCKPDSGIATISTPPDAAETEYLPFTEETIVSSEDSFPVIIDTDMAGDDWMAILFLLNYPGVDIRAITVTGTGEAHCLQGVKNALGLISLAGHEPLPVACGRETPLMGSHVFPADWRNFVDGLAGLTLPEGDANPAEGLNAVQLLSRQLQESAGKVSLLALGPLTNIAELLLSDPSLVGDIDRVVIMGGAVMVPGNLGSGVPGNTVAEWNMYIDPHADNIVFTSGLPILMVGLDATNNTPVTIDFYEKMASNRATPSSEFVFNFLEKIQDFIRRGTYYFWDPLAAAVLVDDSLVSTIDYHLCVLETEGPEIGRTLTLDGCPQIQLAVTADGQLFEQVFLDVLNLNYVP